MKGILLENSDENILEFREAVNASDEDLMNNELFLTNHGSLMDVLNDENLINELFNDEFELIF